MLARNLLHMTPSPLRLLRDAQRLRLETHHPDPALKQPLIKVLVAALERELTRTEHRRPVKPKDIARFYLGHEEWQTQLVTLGKQVGSVVEMGGNVVRLLRGEVRQHVEEGLRHFQWSVKGRGHGLFVERHIGAGFGDGVFGRQEVRLFDGGGGLGPGGGA